MNSNADLQAKLKVELLHRVREKGLSVILKNLILSFLLVTCKPGNFQQLVAIFTECGLNCIT